MEDKQFLLFDEPSQDPLKGVENHPDDISQISGLQIYPDFLTDEESYLLIDYLYTEGNWDTVLQRRTIQYGYAYNFQEKNISPDFIPFPDVLREVIATKLKTHAIIDKIDQCIVNEYEKGQGISKHVDAPDIFSEPVISVSLLSHCVMNFTKKEVDKIIKVPVLLKKNSLLVMTDDARYDWEHEIPAKKTDEFEGIKFPREKRVSLTFRKTIL